MNWTMTNDSGQLVTEPISFPAAGAPVASPYVTWAADATLTNEFNLAALASGVLYNVTGSVPVIADYSQRALPYVNLKDRKTTGTDGGTFTSGSYVRRDLNSEDGDTKGICTLSGNQFTLAAGTYIMRASAPANQVNQNKLRLYNSTDAAVQNNIASQPIVGQSSYASSVGTSQVIAQLADVFVLAGTKTLELQHRCGSTKATDGFGRNGAMSDAEIYSIVELWQVG